MLPPTRTREDNINERKQTIKSTSMQKETRKLRPMRECEAEAVRGDAAAAAAAAAVA